MPITNKLKFIYQEKITRETTTSTDWILQGRMLDGSNLTAGHEYLVVGWVNCSSPANNAGGTKLAFEGGAGDIEGSVHQRHDTNSSGQYIAHIGQFTAPTPTQSIGIYRKMIWNDGEVEGTDFGQCFAIDLSHVSTSGSLISGIDYCSNINTSTRTTSTNTTIHSDTVRHTGGTTMVLAAAKCFDTVAPTTLGLEIDGSVVASGGRYATNSNDMKTVPFAIVRNLASGTTIGIKNIDPQTVTTNYSYIFSLSLDDAPAISATGRLTNWTDHASSSGSWGTQTIDGNNQDSFVIAMGRQTETGVQSGRMASISLLNNTSSNYLLFKERPSGNYSPLYYPATNPGANVGQHELSVIIGAGIIGEADQIEITTL